MFILYRWISVNSISDNSIKINCLNDVFIAYIVLDNSISYSARLLKVFNEILLHVMIMIPVEIFERKFYDVYKWFDQRSCMYMHDLWFDNEFRTNNQKELSKLTIL